MQVFRQNFKAIRPIVSKRETFTMPSVPVNDPQYGPSYFPEHQAYLRKRVLGEALKERVNSVNTMSCQEEEEFMRPFFVCDLGELKRLVSNWTARLPRVTPFYAVKCNNEPNFLHAIASLGIGFDCASKNEIQAVLEMGIDPKRIIFANPCKPIPHVRYAADEGIDMTTVDNIDELYKIQRTHPDCGILVRILTDDANSKCPLSVKFGASLSYAKEIVDSCKKLSLNLRGVAFHVGSGCTDFRSLETAVREAREIFDYAKGLGINMEILDVGGGFSKDTFATSSKVLANALDTHFPEGENVNVIAEPGRYLSATCFTLAANITSKRSGATKERLYLNDGLYGSMNCVLYDHQTVKPRTLTSHGSFHYYDDQIGTRSSAKTYSVWGPTCDGLDCISSLCELSGEVAIGDWLYFENVGAYTLAAATKFNGFQPTSECIFIDTE